jgi:hypothetical protein
LETPRDIGALLYSLATQCRQQSEALNPDSVDPWDAQAFREMAEEAERWKSRCVIALIEGGAAISYPI